ncbi:MAG: PAS domain S-box protein [Planctomycetaceae bacterium]|nr:PAS domain S-box protein [Planctomycetaceae bacterium]
MQNQAKQLKAEQALSDSESRTRAILDAAADAIITIDDHGIVESVNPAAERLFGFASDEMIGRNVQMLMPSPYREEHDSYLNNYLTTGIRQIIGIGREVVGQRKDGTTFPMHLAVSELQLGERRMFTGIARDITDLKHANQQLRDSEARTTAILEAAVDAILTIDTRGRIESLNSAAVRLFGYQAEELIGRNVNLLMPSPFREEHDGYLHNYLRTGERRIIGIGREVTGLRKDGSTFPMELAVSEIILGGQRHFTGIVRDITARVEATAQLQFFADALQQRNAELTRSNEELERFTYTVSHDLKSPLVTIKGFLGRLAIHAAAGDQEKIQADMERINRAAERMRQLLDELLEFSRIGRVPNPPEDVDLSDLAREVIELCSGPIHERGMQVNIQNHLPIIRGDRVLLREVFQNLVENAVKFTTGVQLPSVEIGSIQQHGQSIIYVQDNGIGIEPQYFKKVFGLFEQLSRDPGGSGVGLALAKRIVESHRGQIWIESDGLGKGCRVCITFPDLVSSVR